MQCVVCGYEYTGDFCPVCNFLPIGGIVEDNPNNKKIFEQTIVEYRKQYIGSLSVSIVAYEWKVNEKEEFELDKKNYIPFPPLMDMNCGEISWIEEPFARLEGKLIQLNISINKDSHVIKELFVPIEIPPVEDFWYVGISMEAGFYAKLHLRAGKRETESQKFAILSIEENYNKLATIEVASLSEKDSEWNDTITRKMKKVKGSKICPVCGKRINEAIVCSICGYNRSKDYEEYYSLGEIE